MDTEQKIDTAQEFLKAGGNIIKTRDKFAGGIRDLGLRCHLPQRGCKLKCVKKSKKIITLDTLFLL